MLTAMRVPYESFLGNVRKTEPRSFEGTTGRFTYLLESYYQQGSAMFTEQGWAHWQSYVRTHITKQGYKSNLLRYDLPDLVAFATHFGIEEVVLLKDVAGILMPEHTKPVKIGPRSVDFRMYTDWLRYNSFPFVVMDEQTGSIFDTVGNDYILTQRQEKNYQVRVSGRVAASWKALLNKWYLEGQGKIVDYPVLYDFIKELPKQVRAEVKVLGK